jgi:dienelactone hydrolase
MNTITTRSIAALAATGALVAGGAAAANATDADDSRSGAKSQVTEVEQLVHDAIKDGVVKVEEETAIKKAIEEHSELEFESLEDAVPQG